MDAPANRSPGPLRWGIIALTVITAAIHIWLGLGFFDSGGQIFVLNGFGYLGLLALLLLPMAQLARHRSLIRWLFIAYTAVTVVAWILIGTRTPLAFFDKAVEIALITLLWLDGQRR
jgi:hypothetical protein